MHHPILLTVALVTSFVTGAIAHAQTAANAQAEGGRAKAKAVSMPTLTTLPTPPADQTAGEAAAIGPGEADCSQTVETSFLPRRGFSRAVTKVGSPFAAVRLWFAERRLARASAFHSAASAAASRVSTSSKAVGQHTATATAGSP